jgi:glycine C-acetyltransferase
MDGDLSLLRQITEITEKSKAITIVDDAHGDFSIGTDGRGTPNHLRVAKKIDLYISSLSKGLGSFGGYIASQNNVVDLCINKSKSFIYTSALPSVLVDYSTKRFESDREKQKKKLERNIKQISNGLRQIGYETNSNTHIIPIIIGDAKIAMDFGKFLFDNGVFAQPIRYPTVPIDQARLRLSVTAWLTNQDIEKSLEIFEKGYRKFTVNA